MQIKHRLTLGPQRLGDEFPRDSIIHYIGPSRENAGEEDADKVLWYEAVGLSCAEGGKKQHSCRRKSRAE